MHQELLPHHQFCICLALLCVFVLFCLFCNFGTKEQNRFLFRKVIMLVPLRREVGNKHEGRKVGCKSCRI